MNGNWRRSRTRSSVRIPNQNKVVSQNPVINVQRSGIMLRARIRVSHQSETN